ncbi:MAG: DUF3021 domain-containing protein [Lachnospiraceae bacterium]|nr:DUF3021 domain-containing protein [Lachnospiraceae bacterium]
MKNIIMRVMNGFCYAIAITLVVHTVIMFATGHIPMLSEYVERFDSPVVAYAVQLMLVGFISSVASAGTVILELRRPGLLVQSILYLVLMLVTWIPVACYLWGFQKYLSSMISSILSILVTYGICWGIQYKICKRDVKEINERLKGKQEV